MKLSVQINRVKETIAEYEGELKALQADLERLSWSGVTAQRQRRQKYVEDRIVNVKRKLEGWRGIRLTLERKQQAREEARYYAPNGELLAEYFEVEDGDGASYEATPSAYPLTYERFLENEVLRLRAIEERVSYLRSMCVVEPYAINARHVRSFLTSSAELDYDHLADAKAASDELSAP